MGLPKSPALSKAASHLDIDVVREKAGSMMSQSIRDDVSQAVGVNEEIFNPLRFIALHLKELNEIEKAKK